MKRGYVKLWRKCKGDAIMKDHKLWTLWCYVLMSACHKNEVRVYVNNHISYINKGEFAFTLKTIESDLGMTACEIRNRLKKLCNLGMIELKTTNKMSIISVVNWDIYQSGINDEQQTNNNQETNQTKSASINRSQECKRMEEKNPPPDNANIPQGLVGIIQWMKERGIES